MSHSAVFFLLGMAVGFVLLLLTGGAEFFERLRRWIVRNARRLGVPDAGASSVRHVDVAAKDLVMEIDSLAKARAVRGALISHIWGDTGLPLTRMPGLVQHDVDPTVVPIAQSGLRCDRFTVNMDFGVNSTIDLLSLRGVRRAIVYHQGHTPTTERGSETVNRFIRRGYAVACLSMPLVAPNPQPRVMLRRFGPVHLRDHNFFWLLDAEHSGFCSIKFFVEPVVVAINQLLALGFEVAGMIGLSGGAWTTTLAAAVDTRLVRSYPVAGSLPFPLRMEGELADYENHLPSLYLIANYLELYLLGSLGESRRQIQILNRHDPVGWSGNRGMVYGQCVQTALDKMGGGTFRVVLDSTHRTHRISRAICSFIAEDLQA